MKRNIAMILSLLIIISALSGCGNQMPPIDETSGNGNTENLPVSDQKDFNDNSARNEKTEKADMLLSVLNNEVPFTDETGKPVYMKDYSLTDIGYPICAVPDKYTRVDFDSDGTEELVVHVTPDFGAYLVFRLCGERVYGYEFVERAMLNLKADGTFTGSGGAGLHTFVGMQFTDNGYTLTEIAYQNESAENKEYRINGSPATQEDYQAFYKEYSNKPDVRWTAVDATAWQKSADTVAKKYSSIFKTGDNFTICTDKEKIHYYYTVEDKNGAVMDRGYHDGRGGFDLGYQNGFLLLYYGHGGNSFEKRYYDVSGRRVSQFFPSPVAESDSLVAYFVREDSEIKLIVQNIFDVTILYKEITRDFSDFVFKQNYTGEFIENNSKLRLTYPVNNSTEPITEELSLNQ